jgi:signal peptidase I
MTTAKTDTPAMNAFWENVRTILYALALALVIRFTIAQPFRIPSASMEPTLVVGDYILVTKWSYGYGRFSFVPLEGALPHGRLFGRSPERGDVLVFRPIDEPGKDFIKRVIGLPGDRIEMRGGVLHINGEPVEREYLGKTDFVDEFGNERQIPSYRETLPNDVSYVTFEGLFDNAAYDNTDEFVVPDAHYFMMGDNRDNSDDSRGSVGYVPEENLVGPAQFVVASFDHTTSIAKPWTLFSGFRGERFMKPVE